MKKFTPYGFLLLLVTLTGGLSSCDKGDKNADRGEYITVYTSPQADVPAQEAWLPCAGGSTTLYIRSNVDFKVDWQDGKIPAWVTVGQKQPAGGDLYTVKLDFTALSDRQEGATMRGLYERRDGVLMLTNAGIFLGRYFVLHQGLTKRVGTDFSWLTDGYDIPNKKIGETLYEDWTSSQKAYGYYSNIHEGQTASWCYSKKGYVRLGNEEGAGADMVMPSSSSIANDSLLVLSFAAVAQVGESIGDFTADTEDDVITPGQPDDPGTGDGTEPIGPMKSSGKAGAGETQGKDMSKLRVEILDGGFIRTKEGAKATSMDLELGYYDPSSPKYPSDIFNGQHYLIFIEGDRTNPLTGKTHVRFVAGDVSGASKTPNRIFLDDLYLYRMLKDKDEDFFKLNNSVSGRDMVLGGERNE